jgi:hypothetical protein
MLGVHQNWNKEIYVATAVLVGHCDDRPAMMVLD